MIIYKQLIARAGYKAKLKQMFTEHRIADVIHDINIDGTKLCLQSNHATSF